MYDSIKKAFMDNQLLPRDGGYHTSCGSHGVELEDDGWHAVALGRFRSSLGFNENTAISLLFFYCPDFDEIKQMYLDGEREEADLEAYNFVRAWDIMGPGTAQMLFQQEGYEL